MKRIHFIKQHDAKDCGAACLSMILEYYGKKLPLAEVREDIKVDQYGANVYGIVEGASGHGLEAAAYKTDADTVIQEYKNGNIAGPFIAHIVTEEMLEHFVIVRSVKNRRLMITDPDRGNTAMAEEEFEKCFLGHIIVFHCTDRFEKENRRKGSFSKFIRLITGQKRLILTIGVLSLFVTGTGLAGTFLFQYMIDGVFAKASRSGSELYDFITALLCAAFLYLVRFVIQLFRGKLLTMMSRNIDLPLMLGYYNKVAEMPMPFFHTRKTGEIISRFHDASKIKDAISGVTLTLMIDTVCVAASGIVMLQLSPALFVPTAAVFFLYILVSVLYIKPLNRANREIMEKNAVFHSYLKETIDGMETIKSAHAATQIKEKVKSLFDSFMTGNIRYTMKSITEESLTELITSVGTLAVLGLGAALVIKGDITPGILITFYSFSGFFLSPLQNLINMQDELQTAVVAAERLNDVLDLKSEKAVKADKAEFEKLVMDGISFRYGNRDLVLDNITLEIRRGGHTAVVGESGCGKSTIAKVLLGQYEPEKGSVYIIDKAGNRKDAAGIMAEAAYVPQTAFLFSDTIRNNLLLGIEPEKRPRQEEIEDILRICDCGFTDKMPMGIDTVLEENGADLSGGQRQRLALARALLRNPSILILDEAASALDFPTECQILHAIEKAFPDLTLISITHRLSAISDDTDVYLIDQGRVKEHGKSAKLMCSSGIYSGMRNSAAESLFRSAS